MRLYVTLKVDDEKTLELLDKEFEQFAEWGATQEPGGEDWSTEYSFMTLDKLPKIMKFMHEKLSVMMNVTFTIGVE